MVIVFSLLVAGLTGVLILQGTVLRHLWDQHARIDRRIVAIAQHAASIRLHGSTATIPAARIAPAFTLPNLAGESSSLAALLAPNMPFVLVFVDPRCGPCYELLPDIGGWQRAYGDRMSFVLVSSGAPEANQAMTAEYGIAADSVLLQDAHEVVDLYSLTQGPAAVVVQPDGRLTADPAYGTDAVRRLVAGTLGMAVPPAPGVADGDVVAAVRLGDRVPALLRPDIDGRMVDFAALRGAATLLLFWSPGCGHCQALLPAIQEWEALAGEPRLLVVTRGPIGLNKEVGLRSPMVRDDDRSLARTFGVRATPSAVVIDSLGFVASNVAHGGNDVRHLVAQRFASIVSAVE